MSWYLWLKWMHIVSSTVLFGTGFGIAFFFVRAQLTGNVAIIASVGRDVVLADAVFTAAAVVPAGLGNGTCPHGRLPLVVAVVTPGHCDVFLSLLLLAGRSVAADLDAGFSRRGCHKFEPTAGGVQEILSLVVCLGVACVDWRSLHILSDGGKAELLNQRSSLGNRTFSVVSAGCVGPEIESWCESITSTRHIDGGMVPTLELPPVSCRWVLSVD